MISPEEATPIRLKMIMRNLLLSFICLKQSSLIYWTQSSELLKN